MNFKLESKFGQIEVARLEFRSAALINGRLADLLKPGTSDFAPPGRRKDGKPIGECAAMVAWKAGLENQNPRRACAAPLYSRGPWAARLIFFRSGMPAFPS